MALLRKGDAGSRVMTQLLASATAVSVLFAVAFVAVSEKETAALLVGFIVCESREPPV